MTKNLWLVILDRDGTINEEVNYLRRPEQLKLIPGAAEGIKILKQTGIKVGIVTNQSGIARGYLTRKDLEQVHQKLCDLLMAAGAKIDDILHCPHHPQFDGRCECRKPKTGLIKTLVFKYNVQKQYCFIVGDKLTDIKAGNTFGIKSILVRTGYGKEEEKFIGKQGRPDFIVDNLKEAALLILKFMMSC